MKLTEELQNKVEKQLNRHFHVSIPRPKIRIIGDPQIFFNYYTGIKKERSIGELIRLDSEVSYFYDDATSTIVFRAFRRNGEKSFKKIHDVSLPIGEYIHEYIHHIQVKSGGYGKYNFFDEGCNELCRYVIVGDVKRYSDYWDFVKTLWNFMDLFATSITKKYKLIRDYNVSDSKVGIHNEWLDAFIVAYPKLAKTRKRLVSFLEGDNWNEYASKILATKDDKQVMDDLYKLHDIVKPGLIQLFK